MSKNVNSPFKGKERGGGSGPGADIEDMLKGPRSHCARTEGSIGVQRDTQTLTLNFKIYFKYLQQFIYEGLKRVVTLVVGS